MKYWKDVPMYLQKTAIARTKHLTHWKVVNDSPIEKLLTAAYAQGIADATEALGSQGRKYESQQVAE